MFIKIMIFTFITSMASAHANEWIKISPLSYCSQFHIEYNAQNSQQLRYRPAPGADYITHTGALDNINDLSSMTDVLINAADKFCPMGVNSYQDLKLVCNIPENDIKPFSDEYAGLLKDIINVINQSGDSCSDVIPYIQIQNEITQLRGDELISFKNHKSIFKMFVGEEKEKLLDHFYECGGEKGSSQFIENLIILETRNACLFPKPQGLLTFEQTKAVAKNISEAYPNLGVLNLANKSDDIIKNTVIQFTQKILQEQLTEILGPDANKEEFIKKLDITRDLKNISASKTLDYASYILKIDAPLEIVDKALPHLVSTNLEKTLPKDMPESEKQKILNELILPQVTQKYNSCIKDLKETVKYPNPFKGKRAFKKLVSHRKELEKKFCEQNPTSCEKQICGPSINLGSTNPEKTDMAQIQACLISSVIDSTKPLLEVVIASQKSTFKEHFEMNDIMINSMTEASYEQFYQCADTEVKKKAKREYNEGFTKNLTALYPLSVDDFKRVLDKCSIETEKELTTDFVSLLLGNNSAVQDKFSSNKVANIHGSNIDESIKELTQNIISESVPPCISEQQRKSSRGANYKVATINCRAAIEIEAGTRLIEKAIEETFTENEIPRDIANKEIEIFKKCSIKSKEDFTDSLFNIKHRTPVYDESTAASYLERNHSFFKCVKNMVFNSADLITNKSIDKIIKENEKKLSNPNLFKSLKPEVVSKTKQCFTKGINSIQSWPKFIEFNSNKGLESLQEKCTQSATEFLLPKLIISEATTLLSKLDSTRILTKDEINLVLEDVSNDFIKEYNIEMPHQTLSSRNEYIFARAYRNFKNSQPNGANNIEDFISRTTKLAQLKTIKKIKQNIVGEVATRSYPNIDLSELSNVLTPQCINNFYEINKTKIEDLIALINTHAEPSNSKKLDLRELFIQYLSKGIKRAQKYDRLQQNIKNLELMCTNPKEFESLTKIANLGVADDIVINIIKEKLTTTFAAITKSQCYNHITNHSLEIGKELSKELCESTNLADKDELHSLKLKILQKISFEQYTNLLDFIINGRVMSEKIIKENLDDNFFEELLYRNDKDIINYIYSNFDFVAAGEKETLSNLNKMVVEKIFKISAPSEFATEFIQNQLITGIGLGGYKQAKATIDDSLSELPWHIKIVDDVGNNVVTSNTKSAFESRWNYAGIKHYFNFTKSSSAQQNEVINKVYNNAIIPQVSNSLSEEDKTAKMTQLTSFIADYITNEQVHPNPDYKKPRKITIQGEQHTLPGTKKNLSFTEKLTKDIQQEVLDSIL